MTLRRLATECKDADICPGVWDDDQRPTDVIVVGDVLDPSPVPLGDGEMAVRLRWRTLHEATEKKVSWS